ncbi:hypothetical protein F4859DRAFT_517568 [Xylaria cf. heliscus]|nr:hypothetical protein F4859DRAFT_517568 [Xylaria cf. heliscus]
MHYRDPTISHTLVFIAGFLIAFLGIRVFLPTADWESCRELGIEAGARSRSLSQSSRPMDKATQVRGIVANTSSKALQLFSQDAEYEARHMIRVNGTYNKPSPYRGPPNQHVDTAWERYWKTWIFSVDAEAYHASKPEHPSAAVRLPDGKYLATFEATHQLHCLYNLFRASYRDYYQDEQADYDADQAKWHERVDHCVETLRQKLECDRDTTILTYNWVEGRSKPVINFNAARICPDWDLMDKFTQRHKVESMPRKSDGAVELARVP